MCMLVVAYSSCFVGGTQNKNRDRNVCAFPCAPLVNRAIQPNEKKRIRLIQGCRVPLQFCKVMSLVCVSLMFVFCLLSCVLLWLTPRFFYVAIE